MNIGKILHKMPLYINFFIVCVYSASATAPKKSVQTTLSNMVVKGAGAIALEAKQKMGIWLCDPSTNVTFLE